ncbi:MAG: molecular chaperone Tir [Bacteroidetes bacterium]|jgi:hypothetical protein|nr:molecular chaperone Tir [Bacteroidota bacterium]
MEENFEKVKEFILELGYNVVHEDTEDSVLVISDDSEGIHNLVLGCAPPILIMEQYIMEIKKESSEIYKSLLQKNRDIIHGAFVLDETGTKVIFRDTLQLENLDLNEIEGSINSLALLLSEYSDDLIKFSKS